MLAAIERRERYARHGRLHLTGPQRRRLRHKSRHATPTDEVGVSRRTRRLAVAARLAAHRAWVRSIGK